MPEKPSAASKREFRKLFWVVNSQGSTFYACEERIVARGRVTHELCDAPQRLDEGYLDHE